MTWVLVRKLLRDVRTAWVLVVLLLFGFQVLWARVAHRITAPMVRGARQIAEEVQLTAYGNPEHRVSLSCAPQLRSSPRLGCRTRAAARRGRSAQILKCAR